MTAPELREIAKEIPGVTGVHAMKKPELLSIIKKSKGIKDERPVKKTTKAAYNIRELKQKLVILKQEKQNALKIRDKSRVNILRRRINRIKKMTRKAASAA
ncbi:MAG: transcription termination factor Rho [Deltaproteobacteria bacterium]|nr:transcription termination factor Rho [Deltaproteobacteria bacterium]